MKTKLTYITLMAALFTGCTSITTAEQAVAINNLTPEMVSDFWLHTESQSFDFHFGYLAPTDTPEIAGAGCTTQMRIKTNDKCIASWKDIKGVTHTATIDLGKQKGLGFRPNLLFLLKTNDVLEVTRIEKPK